MVTMCVGLCGISFLPVARCWVRRWRPSPLQCNAKRVVESTACVCHVAKVATCTASYCHAVTGQRHITELELQRVASALPNIKYIKAIWTLSLPPKPKCVLRCVVGCKTSYWKWKSIPSASWLHRQRGSARSGRCQD